MTKQSVAQAIGKILVLKDTAFDAVDIGSYYPVEPCPLTPTAFITSRFLVEYREVNPSRRLNLGGSCELSIEESLALASHPVLPNLGLGCTFADQGRAFVKVLAKRTTHFGTIEFFGHSVHDLCAMYSLLEPHCDVKSAISKFSMETCNLFFEGSKCLLPLSLPLKHLEYHVFDPMALGENEPLVVVPHAVTVLFAVRCQLSFIHSFFWLVNNYKN
jgi:hypothetical protein